MKTPDEIKKALRICSGKLLDYCDACNYCNWSSDCACNSRMCADALDYIQQLENHIGELTEKVAQLEAAQPKWISVDERPPELPCICYDGLNPPRELDAMYRLSIEERELYYSYDVFNLMDILSDETDISEPIDIGSMTHILFWMPMPSMPEPPKEEA